MAPRGRRARTPATVTTETRDTHTGAQLLSPSIPLQRDPGLHPSFMYSLCFDVVVQLNSTSLRLNLHLTTVYFSYQMEIITASTRFVVVFVLSPHRSFQLITAHRVRTVCAPYGCGATFSLCLIINLELDKAACNTNVSIHKISAVQSWHRVTRPRLLK